MKAFSELFTEEYNSQRENWETSLQSELKLQDISSKTTKKLLDIGSWPTLSLEAKATQLSSSAWKKASQTYVEVSAQEIQDDLHAGVRIFFFHKKPADWSVIEKLLTSHPDASDIEHYFLDDPSMVSGAFVHRLGGHNVHELAWMTVQLIEQLQTTSSVGVYVDSHFFQNIAKLRAAKLLLQKVQQETDDKRELKVIALNSYREWTLYERYSNILRNNIQVASAYIGAADVIQSSGYQVLFELESEEPRSEHTERSLRMARNTCHILGLESMLGMVQDAASGSYHLEALTNKLTSEAWAMMQALIARTPAERHAWLDAECARVREVRTERLKTRKDVLAGLNDFPDAGETLNIMLKPEHSFRVARPFEELRLRAEKLKNKPTVQIVLKGDYAALSNRINFVKNYFELLGLSVTDPLQKQPPVGPVIQVLCAKDEDYQSLHNEVDSSKSVARFVAGKVDLPGFTSIYVGQDVHAILSQLLTIIGGGQ